jgi:hypothetical protein
MSGKSKITLDSISRELKSFNPSQIPQSKEKIEISKQFAKKTTFPVGINPKA